MLTQARAEIGAIASSGAADGRSIERGQLAQAGPLGRPVAAVRAAALETSQRARSTRNRGQGTGAVPGGRASTCEVMRRSGPRRSVDCFAGEDPGTVRNRCPRHVAQPYGPGGSSVRGVSTVTPSRALAAARNPMRLVAHAAVWCVRRSHVAMNDGARRPVGCFAEEGCTAVQGAHARATGQRCRMTHDRTCTGSRVRRTVTSARDRGTIGHAHHPPR